MALFFFNLASPSGYLVDDIGTELPSVEMAYLEARAAAVEMVGEMMRDRCDPTRHQFEIVDEEGRFLMDLPFSEVIRPRALSLDHAQIQLKLLAQLRRSYMLRGELRDEMSKSRIAITKSRQAVAKSSIS